MYQLLELFYSTYDHDILDFDLHMLQAWLVVAPSSELYTVLTVLFHKYGGSNVKVKKCMSYFSIFVPTKSNTKSANVNTEYTQVIGIILRLFRNFPIIYPVGTAYYCPDNPSNTILLGELTFYVGF